MRAGPTIKMIYGNDTTPTLVPRSAVAKAREAGFRFYSPADSISAAQSSNTGEPSGFMGRVGNMAGRAVDATPDVMGAVGGFMGVTPQMRAANATRLGIAGRAISHDVNALVGREPSWTPKQAVDILGAEGVRQGAMAYTGEGAAKVFKAVAGPVMKSALGRSAVGSVKKALKYGLAPTEEFLAKTTAKIGAAKERVLQLVGKLTASGRMANYDALVGPLKRELAYYAKNDVTGNETANALREVLQTIEEHIGPKVTQPPMVQGPFGRPLPGGAPVTTPAPDLTPDQLQSIAEITGQKLKDLFAAKQGKLGALPDPRERAYMKVWVTAKNMLGKMGAEGQEIAALNKEMQNLYKVHELARRAGERSVPLISPIEGGLTGAAAATGVAMGHPVALTAIPAASLFRYATTNPEALAAQARFLDSAAAGNVARIVPRIPISLLRQLDPNFNRVREADTTGQ